MEIFQNGLLHRHRGLFTFKLLSFWYIYAQKQKSSKILNSIKYR